MTDDPQNQPDQTGDRDATGKFLPGNQAGKGNPFARHVAKLRKSLMDAVGEDEIRMIVEKLIELAKSGDLGAAREVLQRTLGPAESVDVLERLEQLEARIAAMTEKKA